jgi:hypothetical protein
MAQNRSTTSYSITGLNPYPWIRWWYALVAPPTPAGLENLPLQEREFLRRGKLISIALFIELIQQFIAFGPASQDGASIPFKTILVNIVFLIIAAMLNRNRKLLLAGLLVILIQEAAAFVSMAFPITGKLGIPDIPFLFLMIHPLMISVLLFPAWSILVVGILNVSITYGIWLFIPKTADLQAYMQTPAMVTVIALPIVTLIVCALISYIMITSLRENLDRADKAEEISKLQSAIAEQTRWELQTKQQLETGIQKITSGLISFSNGDQNARIHMEQGHPLWYIANGVNNMMGRFVRLREQEKPMERTFMALQAYLMAIRKAQATKTQIYLPQTGTEVDTLVKELFTYFNEAQRSQQVSQRFQQRTKSYT